MRSSGLGSWRRVDSVMNVELLELAPGSLGIDPAGSGQAGE